MTEANNKGWIIRKNLIIGLSIFLLLISFVIIINLWIIPNVIEDPESNFPYPQVFSEAAGNYLFLSLLGIGIIIFIFGFIDFFLKKKKIQAKLQLEK